MTQADCLPYKPDFFDEIVKGLLRIFESTVAEGGKAMLKKKEILASKVERLQRELLDCAEQGDELFQAAHSAYLKSQENVSQFKKLLQK